MIQQLLRQARRLLNTGVREDYSANQNRRILFSNAILLTLPTVYLVFMVLDYESFMKPLDQWFLDQLSFPLTILICMFCIYLNKLGQSLLSKTLFLVAWPLILHILPIIVQTTPTDYYIAFPLGILFHSTMIQAMFSRRENPIMFWGFLAVSAALVFSFADILLYFDEEVLGANVFVMHPYYRLVILLYWMLFNLLFNYILSIIDNDVEGIEKDKKIIEQQNENLGKTLIELKKTQAQLVQAEKMSSIGVFTAGIAHEVNNPLNYIYGGLNELKALRKTIKQDPEALELYKESMDMIKMGLDKSSQVIKALVQLSYQHHEKQLVDMESMVENTILLSKHSIPAQIKVTTNLDKGINLMVYPDQIHQILFNILFNAIDSIKANEAKGSIQVKSKLVDDQVQIHIVNTGPSIPEENLSLIFDPFFTTKEPGQGTGLGLWIAYQFAQDHGGNIRVNNRTNGVEFILTLPLVKSNDSN